MNQPTANPTQKVAAAGIGGSLTILIVYVIQQAFDVQIPAEVASALTALISFASGYLVREKPTVRE